MADLADYLSARIPLTNAMGVEVRVADPHRVVLAAPLAPNINHQKTAFGGSVAALATLAAWSLIRVRLHESGRDANVVIQRSRIEYRTAIEDELVAVCEFDDDELWDSALVRLGRRGRSRLEVTSRLEQQHRVAVSFTGTFVMLADREASAT